MANKAKDKKKKNKGLLKWALKKIGMGDNGDNKKNKAGSYLTNKESKKNQLDSAFNHLKKVK